MDLRWGAVTPVPGRQVRPGIGVSERGVLRAGLTRNVGDHQLMTVLVGDVGISLLVVVAGVSPGAG